MPVQTYVAGDVHLHDAGGPFMGFLEMLQQQDPAHLIILGDLFDYWLDTDRCVEQFQSVFGQLQALRKQGWRLDFVQGNRELSAGSRLRLACGARMHWPSLDISVGDKRIRIVHGDRLCHDPGYHMMAVLLRGFWSRGFHMAMPGPVHHSLARLGRSLSKGSSNKGKDNKKLAEVFIDPRRIEAHKRQCDILIAGHIHQVRHQDVRGLELLIVGDWQANNGHWIEIDHAGNCRQCARTF